MHMAYSLVKSQHSCTPHPILFPRLGSLGKSPNSFSQEIARYSFPEKGNSLLPLWSLLHGQERNEVEEAHSTTTPSARNVQRPESIESTGPKAREVPKLWGSAQLISVKAHQIASTLRFKFQLYHLS